MSERSARGGYTAAARQLGQTRAASLEGLGPALEGLGRLADAIDGDTMQALVEEHTDYMLADARDRVRFGKTGRYREAIRSKVFANEDGFAGTVFVIQGPWYRNPSKLWPANLPLWLEYGTRRMDPRQHLLPALNAARERFNRAVERLLQGAASA